VTPQVYVPYLQFAPGSMTMVLRTAADPLSLAAAVRNQVLAIDRELPVYEAARRDEAPGACSSCAFKNGQLAINRQHLISYGGQPDSRDPPLCAGPWSWNRARIAGKAHKTCGVTS